jgi:tetratricopeptide (TPR) repeat protein
MAHQTKLATGCFAICLLTFSVTPTSAAGGDLWVGKMVIPKEAGVQISVTTQDDRVVDLGVLDRVVYRVINEQGPWIMVQQYGVEGWFLKEKAVLVDDATGYFSEKITANPSDDRAWAARGAAWRRKAALDNAIQDMTESIRLAPENPAWHNNRGLAFHNKKDHDRAIANYTEAIRLDPTDSVAYYNRGNGYRSKQDYARAQADYLEALRLNPKDPNPHNGLAWLLATCPVNEMRDGRKAVEYAKRACELTDYHRASDLGTLAAAYAEAGQFEEATKWQRQANDDADYVKIYGAQASLRYKLYADRKPYREDASTVVKN